MFSSSLLQFAADCPFVACFLSLPLAAILIGASWAMTVLISNAMNACAMVWNQFLSSIIVLIHGYPPPDSAQRGDEEKPLAS